MSISTGSYMIHRIVKGWTQEQVFEWEDVCENLRGNERIKGMLIVPGDKKKEK